MKSVKMFVTSWCPYCKMALSIMDELKESNPTYKNIDIEIIDEEREPDIAKEYDYYYVPTYFVDDKKLLEGVPSKEIIQSVFETALK
ncbi:MAG: glutaredoxin [Clostridium sp.]|nr:glutaredoxin [Clostridium sp.]